MNVGHQTVSCRLSQAGFAKALLEKGVRAPDGLAKAFSILIRQGDLKPLECCPSGDLAAHYASTYHMNVTDGLGGFFLAGHAFEPLLELVNAQ